MMDILKTIFLEIIVPLFKRYVSGGKLQHFEKLKKKSFRVDDDLKLYMGFAPTKADIGSYRDVIRELHHQLFPQILETKNSQKNSYLSIIAPPQEGKSTLLLRFAKELVDRKEIVLWADATYKFAQENPFDELKLIRRWRKKRIFTFIDNIARLSRYSEFLQDLARQPNVKVTLIGASRVGDWEKVKFKHPTGIEYLFEKPHSKPRLPYRLGTTKADIEATKKKLQEKEVLKRERVPGRKPDNFFILIWASAAPEGEENFSSVMLEEADKLSEEEKKAYCYICALDRFGMPMPVPLIKRLLGKDAIWWLESLMEKRFIRYIAKDDSYISKHEVVADTIFKNYCPQMLNFQPHELYKNILQKATLKDGELMVLLFQRYLNKNLKAKLKSQLVEKYEKTFFKSRSAELLGLGWGPILHELSYCDLAERTFRKSLDIREKFPEAHINYANLLFILERYQEAEKHYQRGLDLKEDIPKSHCNYALLLVKLKRYPEAEMHFKRALELKEDFPEAHDDYAILLAKQQRDQDAEKHFKRTLELKEDYPEAHFNYAILLEKLEIYFEAEKHYKRALELKKKYPKAMAYLGLLYLRNGFRQPEKASYWLKKAWEHRERLPDKGQMVRKALDDLSSEEGNNKEQKSPKNEL